jgi:hypothetical protein
MGDHDRRTLGAFTMSEAPKLRAQIRVFGMAGSMSAFYQDRA